MNETYSGASAKRADRVRNRETGVEGVVLNGTMTGRLNVLVSDHPGFAGNADIKRAHIETWERWNVEVLPNPDTPEAA